MPVVRMRDKCLATNNTKITVLGGDKFVCVGGGVCYLRKKTSSIRICGDNLIFFLTKCLIYVLVNT